MLFEIPVLQLEEVILPRRRKSTLAMVQSVIPVSFSDIDNSGLIPALTIPVSDGDIIIYLDTDSNRLLQPSIFEHSDIENKLSSLKANMQKLLVYGDYRSSFYQSGLNNTISDTMVAIGGSRTHNPRYSFPYYNILSQSERRHKSVLRQGIDDYTLIESPQKEDALSHLQEALHSIHCQHNTLYLPLEELSENSYSFHVLNSETAREKLSNISASKCTTQHRISESDVVLLLAYGKDITIHCPVQDILDALTVGPLFQELFKKQNVSVLESIEDDTMSFLTMVSYFQKKMGEPSGRLDMLKSIIDHPKSQELCSIDISTFMGVVHDVYHNSFGHQNSGLSL